jgi:ATP-dependent helicase/nuclease subunit B
VKREILEGPAGCGKTAHLLQQAYRVHTPQNQEAPDHAPLVTTFFVVPDQATFLMEKRVLETMGDRAGASVRVFSLSRLARHILSETGNPEQTFLDAAGKGVLVYRVVRALADRLPMFSDAIRKGGFSAAAADLIAECRRYGVTPEQLRVAAERASDARLSVKLGELSVMAEAVAARMTSGAYQDAEDLLALAAERVVDYPEMARLHLCVDQFQRLSPMQLRLVGACMRHMASVTIALRLQEEPQPPGLAQEMPGRASRRIRDTLLTLAAQSGVPVTQTCLPARNIRHRPGSGLAHLTGQLSAFQPTAYAGVPTAVKYGVFPNPEAEIHACAEKIHRLCRDGHCRFRDLAVLIPDVSEYAASVPRIFQLHDIPFFMDRKASLAGHPVSVALLAVFDILRGGWRHDDVFRLLKTGLLPIPMADVDRLENRALAMGLRTAKLWQETVFEEEALETARTLLTGPLMAFRRRFRGKVPGREGLVAYVTLLQDWHVPQAIAAWARTLSQRGALAEAGHTRQIWQSACSLMDQILTLSVEDTITLTELHGMLQSGLEAGTTGIIPPSLEEVFVGTPSRSQLARIRHLFVLGAVEGWIPSQPGGQGLLSDLDRQRLRECGLLLAPDTREAGLERRDELDAVLTAPEEGLWLSRPVSDMEGKALHPSTILTELRQLFPALSEGWDAPQERNWLPETGFATTPRALLERLAPMVGTLAAAPQGETDNPASAHLRNLLRLCAEYPELQAPLRSLQAGLEWRNTAVLDPVWMRARYGRQLNHSISGLELYRRCPFSWFARYAAGLREREEAGLHDVGFGLLLHEVLDELVAEILARGGWEQVPPEALDEIVACAVDKGLRHGTGISPLHPGLRQWFAGRMEKAARIAAERVYRQIRGGLFRPLGHELVFGENGMFPPYRIPLAHGGQLQLHGRLDRLDIHETPEGRYVRVVAYKSGDRSLSLADIANGLSMQLPAYLTVALASLAASTGDAPPPRPAGIFHMRLEPPDIRMKDVPSPEAAQTQAVGERDKRMRLSGYVLDDPDVLAAMDAQLSQTGTSTLIKASLKRDGTVSGTTRTLSEKGFVRLGELLQQRLARLGEDLLDGRIPVCPVRVTNMTACGYCPYAWVCRFEPGLGGVTWDRPPALSESAVREELEREATDEMDH